MNDFTELVDLASERLGGAVLYANDEFFAPKEYLLKPSAPVFKEGVYTDRGKWMDGWETRRRRTPGFDWCVVRLGLPGVARGVVVDTAYFKGNYPESCSLEACDAGVGKEFDNESVASLPWRELLPRTRLQAHTRHFYERELREREAATHVRFRIYPDGGVSRLRLYGTLSDDA